MKTDFLKYYIEKEIPDIGKFSAQILSYGPFVRSLRVPVRLGEMRDVVLGYQELYKYPRLMPGEDFSCVKEQPDEVCFSSADGSKSVTYKITPDTLIVEGNIIPVMYFNLMGHGVLNILDHRLIIRSDAYIGDAGEVISIKDDTSVLDRYGENPLDFNKSHQISERIRVGHSQLTKTHGYDSVYVLSGSADEGPAASLTDFYYDLTLEVRTNAKRMRVETANRFSGRDIGKGGCIYPVHGGIQFTPIAEGEEIIRAEYSFKHDDS